MQNIKNIFPFKYIISYFEMRKKYNKREIEIFIKHMPNWYKTLELNFWSKFFRIFTLILLLFSTPLNKERLQSWWEEMMQTTYDWSLFNNILFIITIIGILYYIFYAFLKFVLGFVFIKKILCDKSFTSKANLILNIIISIIIIIFLIIIIFCWYYINTI